MARSITVSRTKKKPTASPTAPIYVPVLRKWKITFSDGRPDKYVKGHQISAVYEGGSLAIEIYEGQFRSRHGRKSDTSTQYYNVYGCSNWKDYEEVKPEDDQQP